MSKQENDITKQTFSKSLSVADTINYSPEYYEYLEYLQSIGFRVYGELTLEQCVKLAEEYEKDSSILKNLSPTVIHDLNRIMDRVVKYLDIKKSQMLQELEETKKRVALLEEDAKNDTSSDEESST